jgi:hypothetical protein
MHLDGHGRVAEERNDLNSNQVKKYFCKYCGTQIRFNDKMKSKSGKSIPLNLDMAPHMCHNNPYSVSASNPENTKIYHCNYCAKDITFENNMKTPSGKSIPLNPDKTNHDCPHHPNKLVEQGRSQKPSEHNNEGYEERIAKDYLSNRTDEHDL